jgi:hypothetical protein
MTGVAHNLIIQRNSLVWQETESCHSQRLLLICFHRLTILLPRQKYVITDSVVYTVISGVCRELRHREQDGATRRQIMNNHCLRIPFAAMLAALFGLLLVFAPTSNAQFDGDPTISPTTVYWPFEEDPSLSLSSAVRAVPDGGRLVIAPGVHQITSTINITRRIIIEGSGCHSAPTRAFEGVLGALGLQTGKPMNLEPEGVNPNFTRLEGPAPSEQVEPSDALGMFNFIGAGAGGLLKGMELTGFDAAVKTSNAGENFPSLTIQDVCVKNTGYGIVATGGINLNIDRTSIQQTLHHGISIFNSEAIMAKLKFSIFNVFIQEAAQACIYVENASVMLVDSLFLGCGPAGGIAGFNSELDILDMGLVNLSGPGIILVESTGTVIESTINGTVGFGILLFDSPVYLQGNIIRNTESTSEGIFGDGIASVLSSGVTLVGNKIWDASRAGISIFGGDLSYQSSQIRCTSFDLVGEEFMGENYTIYNLGENKCGCPEVITDDCILETSGIQPPVAPPQP